MKDTAKDANAATPNVYKLARLRAAKENIYLETLDSASELLYIGREKLGQIEQEDPRKKQTIPNSDDVARMIEVYNAPELRNYYCVHHCPLGTSLPVLEHENLDRISLRLLVALQRIEQVRDELGDILVDGVVGDTEKKKFQEIVGILKNIAGQANSLELWAQKNGLI